MKKGTSEIQETLREARRNILRETRRAKCNWQLEFSKNCQRKNCQANPTEAWQMIFKLMEGFQKLFKNQSGAVAPSQKENYLIVESHWNSLQPPCHLKRKYNRQNLPTPCTTLTWTNPTKRRD
jgi:hypothetical protein